MKVGKIVKIAAGVAGVMVLVGVAAAGNDCKSGFWKSNGIYSGQCG